MRYYGTVVRPPSEAHSYILQVTYGCSHNRCAFCGTYLDKPFQVRPPDEALEDISLAQQRWPGLDRVFLADGNALVLSVQRLAPILDALNSAFPDLERVACYANARDILDKSEADLELLCQKGLRLVYLGLESGSDEVLRRIRKGATAAQMIQAIRKAKAAGMQASVIGLLGIAGPELSSLHAEATGQVVSAMDPDYFSMLRLSHQPCLQLSAVGRDAAAGQGAAAGDAGRGLGAGAGSAAARILAGVIKALPPADTST